MNAAPPPFVFRLLDEHGRVASERCLLCGGELHEPVVVTGVTIYGCPAVPPNMLIPVRADRSLFAKSIRTP